jgi:hypothetical protein
LRGLGEDPPGKRHTGADEGSNVDSNIYEGPSEASHGVPWGAGPQERSPYEGNMDDTHEGMSYASSNGVSYHGLLGEDAPAGRTRTKADKHT